MTQPPRRRKRMEIRGFRETRAMVPVSLHDRIIEMAVEQHKRLAVMISDLLDFAVTTIDGGLARQPVEFPPDGNLDARPPIQLLARAIIKSRFEGDTGAARYKQLAFVTFILAEHRRGEPPTAGSLAQLVGTHRSQIDLIATLLQERGLISKTSAPGYKGAQHNTILDVRPDAIQAYKRAHLDQTGIPLDLED
jgi:hypothetical protein